MKDDDDKLTVQVNEMPSKGTLINDFRPLYGRDCYCDSTNVHYGFIRC